MQKQIRGFCFLKKGRYICLAVHKLKVNQPPDKQTNLSVYKNRQVVYFQGKTNKNYQPVNNPIF